MQLSENWALLTVLQHIQSMFIDRDKINMQLSYTLAFEWKLHWLPVMCVCVCV